MPPAPAILSENKILLGLQCATKWEAIAAAGQLLVAAGHVGADYPGLMAARELTSTTYIGNGVAVPHGTREAMAGVRSPGISILQIPKGVDFSPGQRARLVLGLAARDDAHLPLLTHIATVCADDAQLERLLRAASPTEIIAALAVPGTVETTVPVTGSSLVVVRNPGGLHARPAHKFAAAARVHPGAVRLRKGDRVADGKSVLAVLTLGVKCGDSVTVEVDGGDAELLSRLERIVAEVLVTPAPGGADRRAGAGTRHGL